MVTFRTCDLYISCSQFDPIDTRAEQKADLVTWLANLRLTGVQCEGNSAFLDVDFEEKTPVCLNFLLRIKAFTVEWQRAEHQLLRGRERDAERHHEQVTSYLEADRSSC